MPASSAAYRAAVIPADLIKGAVLKVYRGSGHALPGTGCDRLHADVLEFIDS
jgi:hypothetical protein